MSLVNVFAARYSALDYAYGISPSGGPPLTIGTGNSLAGAGTIVLDSGQSVTLAGGQISTPVVVSTPITVGIGANAETVTPTAVSAATGVTPGTLSISVTATFANVHGVGEPVASGTFGLQEAINRAAAGGGGLVVVTPAWYSAGGTVAIIQAATMPSSGTVTIEDLSAGGVWALGPNSLTLVSAPVAATSALVASQAAITGTWPASTEHVLFTYVTADGGETLASPDYSFTATLNKAIGGSGPIAATGAVGYRVYIGLGATTTCYLVPAIAANGTVVACGPLAAFKIGTPFSVATATTNTTPNPPLVQSTAFSAVQPMPYTADYMAQSFQTVSGPFAVTGVVTAGTAIEWGRLQLPAGFLNFLNRTVRLTLYGYFTPVSTATLIVTVAIASVAGVTTTTVFTVTTPATSGTAAANINGVIDIITAATGAAGTVECHGTLLYGGATGTAGLLVAAGDSVQAASGAIDLTAQDTVIISINSGTANLTQSQLRRLIVEVLV